MKIIFSILIIIIIKKKIAGEISELRFKSLFNESIKSKSLLT